MKTETTADGERVDRLLFTTALARFCAHPEIARALAQDRLAAELEPYLAVPDLFRHENNLLRDWAQERAGPEQESVESAALLESAYSDVAEDVRAVRRALRRTALRRLDALAVGREVFSPCPRLFGEPHRTVTLPNGSMLKVGIVRMAHYWPKPETERISAAWRQDTGLVRRVEEALFPLLPVGGPQEMEEFATATRLWLEVAPLREFEARSPLPLFPHALTYPESYVPRGYSVRIHPETIREAGGNYLTLAAAGLSPYLANPFRDYCVRREETIVRWMGDVRELAARKWRGAHVLPNVLSGGGNVNADEGDGDRPA